MGTEEAAREDMGTVLLSVNSAARRTVPMSSPVFPCLSPAVIKQFADSDACGILEDDIILEEKLFYI